VVAEASIEDIWSVQMEVTMLVKSIYPVDMIPIRKAYKTNLQLHHPCFRKPTIIKDINEEVGASPNEFSIISHLNPALFIQNSLYFVE
jgi:hypothetical protein